MLGRLMFAAVTAVSLAGPASAGPVMQYEFKGVDTANNAPIQGYFRYDPAIAPSSVDAAGDVFYQSSDTFLLTATPGPSLNIGGPGFQVELKKLSAGKYDFILTTPQFGPVSGTGIEIDLGGFTSSALPASFAGYTTSRVVFNNNGIPYITSGVIQGPINGTTAPEPATLALLASAVPLGCFYLWRSRKRS